MLSYRQAPTGIYLPTGITLGKHTARRHQDLWGVCLFTSVFPDMRSIREEPSHGPGGGVGPGGLGQPPPRGPALAQSLSAKPKSLPQHPKLEGYSLCRVCSAASALCPHIESPHLRSLSVFSLVFCLVSFLASVCSFISSFICLWENTAAASEGPRAGGSGVEVRLHEEVSHLLLWAVMMALTCAVALLALTRPSQFGPRAFAGTLLCCAPCPIP